MRRDAPHKFLSRRQRYSALVLTILLILSIFFSTNISISKSSNNSVVCNVFFAKPIFQDITMNEKNYTQIKMKYCVSFAENSGDPTLPVYPAKILIPNGKKVKDVSVSNNPFVLIKNDLVNKPIAPQQEAIPFSVDADKKFFVINKSLYESDEPVFKNLFSIGNIGFCRGYKILTVFLYPVQYIPKDGLLYYSNKMTISVNFEDDFSFSKAKNCFLRGSKNDEQVLSLIVENPNDAITYMSTSSIIAKGDQTFDYSGGICDSTETYEYVIITSNSIKDTTGYDYNLSDLISHRQSYSGLNGIIVSVEEINACSAYFNQTALFNDTQAHIREFCKDAYLDWDTEYVLIVGDWDSDSSHQIVPYRLFTDRFETEVYADMACDLYYSHLDGDWYHSSSGFWGGGINSGINDFYSELFVGRITASNAEMVSNAVSKIINYDTNESLSDNWLRTVSFWGGDLGWDANSKDYMEEIRLGTDTYRTFTGFEEFNAAYPGYAFYTSERLYHKDLGSDYKTYFENSVKNNNASIINHIDHSSWTNPLSLSTWDSLSSNKPFLGYSQGCLAGRYQSGEAGCEKLICTYSDKHAYALILNVGYGYGSASTTDGASQYMMAYFWDYFLNNQSDNHDNWQLGRAMAYSQDKIATVINSHSHAWCYTWYSIHLFGDPAQTLRLSSIYFNEPVCQADPNPLNGSTDVSVDITELNITLSDNDGDVFNWSIQTYPNIGSNTGFNDIDGIKICNLTDLVYGTNYTWFVNASDGDCWNKSVYYFTVRNLYTPNPPVSLIATGLNRFEVQISWINDDLADSTRLEWSNISDETWDIGDHTLLYNGSLESFYHTNLSPGLSCFYKLWSYNNTDNVWSSSTSSNAITYFNLAPSVVSVNPVNGSAHQNLSLNWSVTISDSEGDSFNYTIECNNGQFNSSNDVNNATFQVALTDLDYNTIYTVWINITDSFNYSRKWYTFTTEHLPGENLPPILFNSSPSNGTSGVSVGLSSLQIMINEPNGDVFDWSIQTSPDIGNNSGDNAYNGSVSCSVSSLSYSTLYTWFVNVTDGSLRCNWTYVFTTESESNPSSHHSSNDNVVINTPPVADAGGPYCGFVNASINFNGSNSTDTDRNIVSYSWNFGDGITGSGVLVSHIYRNSGNYTVSLTVTDKYYANNTDTASVTVQENFSYSNLTNDVFSEISDNNDSNSTFISNDVIIGKIKDLLNIDNEVKIQKVDNLGASQYLLDSNNDGIFDVLYDYKTGFSTNIKSVGDDDYFLDINGDGIWDYKYNILYNILSAINPILNQTISKEVIIYPGLILLIILIVVFILLILIFKRRSRLPEFRSHSSFASHQVHFFSKDKKDTPSYKNVNKLNEKYNHVQSIYSDSNKSDIIYDSVFNSDNVSILNKPKNIAPTLKENTEFDPMLDEIRSHVDALINTRVNTYRSSVDVDRVVDDLLFSKQNK